MSAENHSANRILCEECGLSGIYTFTDISDVGALDPRRLCKRCHIQRGFLLALKMSNLADQILRPPGQRP